MLRAGVSMLFVVFREMYLIRETKSVPAFFRENGNLSKEVVNIFHCNPCGFLLDLVKFLLGCSLLLQLFLSGDKYFICRKFCSSFFSKNMYVHSCALFTLVISAAGRAKLGVTAFVCAMPMYLVIVASRCGGMICLITRVWLILLGLLFKNDTLGRFRVGCWYALTLAIIEAAYWGYSSMDCMFL